MITNKGRNILAKYLIGQAPAYASYIALGVGPQPKLPSDPVEDYSAKTELEFEAVRVPISSRGYVYDENGNANVVFVGELPTEQRYEFTEIGVFSSKSNPVAGSYGSRAIYTFSEAENWEYHTETEISALQTVTSPLYGNSGANIIDETYLDSLGIGKVFRSTSNNALFSGSDLRVERNERARFLDKTLLIKGDTSTLETNIDGNLEIASVVGQYTASHIHYLGATPNLNPNSSNDELRMAFSVVSKYERNDIEGQEIDSVKILLEFASTDSVSADNFAKLQVDLSYQDIDFASNRYFVVSNKISEMITSAGFTWNDVNVAKIYVSVYEKPAVIGDPPVLSPNFYVALDGLRFENLTSISPLYGMTGYSVISNSTQETFIKDANSSNLVEFRFGLDVQ